MPYFGTLGYQRQVERVIRDWAAHNPLELEHVKRAAERIMQMQGDAHARTREGYLKGGITDSLNRAMCAAFGVSWNRDQTIRNIFWRTFAIGRFNTYENWRH